MFQSASFERTDKSLGSSLVGRVRNVLSFVERRKASSTERISAGKGYRFAERIGALRTLE
jgi:hypothetical protein